jgi:CBS domain-containing protein
MEATMKVSECMSRDVRMVGPRDSIRQAAVVMAEIDAGVLPVASDERLVGIITDRDIAIRAVGNGLGADTKVDQVMTHEVRYCFEYDEIGQVLDNMADVQLRRLPVLDEDKRLAGIVSLSDMALMDKQEAGQALSDIARPSALHSQMV